VGSGEEKFKQARYHSLLLILLNTRARESHSFGVSHSAVTTVYTVTVLYDVYIEEEEAVEH
jgi:hypothetical protein